MQVVARLTAALTTALLPLVALAQATEPATEPMPGAYRWLWALVAAVILVALFRMFFSRSRRTPGAGGP